MLQFEGETSQMEIRIHPSPVAQSPPPPPPLLMGFIYLCTCSALLCLARLLHQSSPSIPTPTQSPLPLHSPCFLASFPRPISSLLVKAKRGEGGRERGREGEREREREAAARMGWPLTLRVVWCEQPQPEILCRGEDKEERERGRGRQHHYSFPPSFTSLSLYLRHHHTVCQSYFLASLCLFWASFYI